ncbi:TPA: methyl-accepting chemotaxis protein [Kluyvera intermedia]|uniref:Chemotaxis protein n=2 Tax=Enterobacteriaceae TaxID=543 RepID=A0AAC8QQZ8_9ENTR|nr:methyl-accepting chemotaxis protein [Phytobacter ursingii]HAT2205418.1 methyl-accepting chemotaxis protein [Kluyvera intermedia]AKL13206.1 chemotaxis protein [Phytobacter ursingii]HAT2516144.1 methyl-accepting chemotaxis protein [Kluyvera intermedia]HAT2603827.1 methyl-accepting chemotaxis protein [Kluyvera intermedia]HAT2680724.1 methyl-accepting chemotaxis protein [Kluyvera intermedia]
MRILRDITIRKMVLLILVLFSIIWGMASLLTFYNFSTLEQLLTQNSSQKNAYAMLVKGNDQYFRTMTRMLRAMDYRQTGDEENAAKTMESAGKALAISQNMLAQFRDARHPGVSDDVIRSMINDWDSLLTNAIVPMYDAAKNNQTDKFRELFRKTYPPLSVQFGATAEKYTQAIQSDAILMQTNAQISYNKIVLISALLAGLVTLLLTDRYLVNYLVKPLGMLKNHLELLTAGKLSSQLDNFGRNCAGQLIPYVQKMQESLQTTVKTIQDSSASIFANTSEIRGGNEELSSRTEQQAAALQQTAASMEELTSTVRNNAQNVREALKLTEEAQRTAKRGGDITSTVVQTMHGITDSSQKISDITSVINSISFQTNLLALNAAVEAARAGEQGRGFAVVASEVRLLAQRSAQAAKEIEALISESVNRVKTGAEQVQEAGDAMAVIIQSVAQVNSLMGEISVASDEQSRGIEQIGLAMTEMDGVTQQNATLVQEATANAVSLESEAERLNKTVDRFDLGNGAVSTARSTKKTSATSARVPLSSTSNDNWQTF